MEGGEAGEGQVGGGHNGEGGIKRRPESRKAHSPTVYKSNPGSAAFQLGAL